MWVQLSLIYSLPIHFFINIYIYIYIYMGRINLKRKKIGSLLKKFENHCSRLNQCICDHFLRVCEQKFDVVACECIVCARKRLEWANAHIRWRLALWRGVLFMDESGFSLYRDRFTYISLLVIFCIMVYMTNKILNP